MRIQLKQLGARNEMVTRDFEESKNKLEIEAAKNLSSSVDQKGNLSPDTDSSHSTECVK